MKPLADVRVLALEQYGAGPFGSMHLAHLGADVIKLEDPRSGGDVGRYVGPFAEGGDSLFFEAKNYNKRSIGLDLTHPSGRAVFEDLVRHADAVYSNLRGDVPAKLRICYDDLKHLNQRIVCCSLSGYGTDGPRAADPGYDYVIQGLAGWMTLNSTPDGPPQKTGLSLVDFSGGYAAAVALLAGIHAARRDGSGMDCDVSLFDTAIGLLGYQAAWHLTAGYEPSPTRRSAHPSLVPCQLFPTKDGWIVVMCAKEKFWRRLVVAIGRDALAVDARFATFADRAIHRDVLEQELDAVFKGGATGEWLEALRAAGVPCGPVNDVSAALRDEQTLARDLILSYEHPRFGTVRLVGSPVRVGPRTPEYRRAPRFAEDGDSVLREILGYDDESIAHLRADGVLATTPGSAGNVAPPNP